MERLTESLGNGQYMVRGCGENCKHNYKYCRTDDCPTLNKTFEKLGQYEDLEEKGRLVKLPCKFGDEVWYIDTDESIYTTEIVRGVVEGYIWFRTCGFALNVVWDRPIMGHFAYCRKEMPFSEIGKSIFLTQEQAEQALKQEQS